MTFERFLNYVHPEDRDEVKNVAQTALKNRQPFDHDRRIIWPDGTIRIQDSRGAVEVDAAGNSVRVYGTVQDITERKQAEEALRESEERLRQTIRVSDIGIFDHDHRADTIYWSPMQRNIFGWGPDESVTLPGFLACVYPEDLERIGAAVRRAHDPAGDGLYDVEHRIVRRDGEVRWISTRSQTFFEGEGRARRPVRTVGANVDITARKRAEEALRTSEERFRASFKNAVVGMGLVDHSGRFVETNRALSDITGFSEEELKKLTFTDITHPDDRADNNAVYQKMLEEKREGIVIEKRYLRKDGKTVWVTVSVGTIRDLQGNVTHTIGLIEDITERKRAEEALRESSQLNQQVITNAREGIIVYDREIRYRVWNKYMEEQTGLRQEEVLGKHPTDIFPLLKERGKMFVKKETMEGIQASAKRALTGESFTYLDVPFLLPQTGLSGWNSVRYGPFRNAEGEIIGVIATVWEITERKRAEEALRESSQFNQQIIASALEGIIVYDRELRYLVWNPFMEEMTGLRAEEILGKRPRDLPTVLQQEHGKVLLTKEAAEGIETSLRRAMTGETFTYLDVPIHLKQTGMTGWASARYGPFCNAQGEIIGVIAIIRDITERKRLEEQLRHAQKLEAVGHLAGGVAHEFNNMLTAIIGNLDLALRQTTPESDQHSTLTGALQAARRAGMLTQQLLTFSHRTPMDPQPQDLNGIAREVVQLLRQTIDRRIQVSVRNGKGPWPVLADANQMHQVIMNLCVNARDSLMERMEETSLPSAGPAWEPRIVIAMENVNLDEADCRGRLEARPGEYVCLSVSDNGCGIDEEVRHRIFEPFFTTKEVGHGTGLGLAAVHGIIKQHAGWIDLASVKNIETTFKICLPRSLRTVVPTPSIGPGEGIMRGTETILFVDDEASIRRLGQTILEHHGYSVLLANNGEEALEIFQREHGRIRLVVLDLTMPRLSGRDVLKQLLRINPKIRVLISSGHQTPPDANELQRQGLIRFVPKPYRPDDLAQSVRSLLDASPTA